MIVHVANPIYDSVFKYIMEDERIAKTVLSALLKKEVVHVTVRPHEYANTTRNAISMFRIDFAATVVEDDGSEQVILIELQKTWLRTMSWHRTAWDTIWKKNAKRSTNATASIIALLTPHTSLMSAETENTISSLGILGLNAAHATRLSLCRA